MTVKKKQCCIIAVLAILVVIVGIAAIPHSTKIMRGGVPKTQPLLKAPLSIRNPLR